MGFIRRRSGELGFSTIRGGIAMNYAADNQEDFGAALAFLGFLPFVILFLTWLVSAIVAGVIAEERGRSGFGFAAATFFFLGPLGVGVALLATRGEVDRLPPTERRKVADGRQRFICPRCGAENDIPESDTSYDCWRCGEHRSVKPKVASKPAPIPTPKPTPKPTGKASREKGV
jgi:DNA-directed RNA polymerase subunit RPC12/RpoP